LSLPGTRSGWWSLGLFVGSWIFLALFYALVASGQRGGQTFFSNPWLAVVILAAFAAAVAGGATAAAAISWRRERSFLSILALLFGLLVLIFAIGEIAFPH
jgi:hypothetical protein